MLIWIHLIAASVTIVLGTLNLVLVKGTFRHKLTGWLWIVCMLGVTLPSFGIRELNDGDFAGSMGSRCGRCFRYPPRSSPFAGAGSGFMPYSWRDDDRCNRCGFLRNASRAIYQWVDRILRRR